MGDSQEKIIYYRLAPVEDMPARERLFIEIDGHSIMIFSTGTEYLAIGDVCTHDGGEIGTGEIDGEEIICPRHGARFNMRSGKAMSLPAVIDIPVYPVRVVDDYLEIGIPN
jgi:3-phenylpropionate/trans-cinnamate dioxygenase ferredoxin subunit